MSDKLTKCKACQHEVSKSAKKCPNCGQKLKSKKWLWIGLGALIIVLIGLGSGTPSSNRLKGEKPSESSYASAETLNYRKGLVEEYDVGSMLITRGEIAQIVDKDTIIISTKNHGFMGYSGDRLWVEVDNSDKYAEKDILTIKGRYNGTYEYTTALRTKAKVPVIQADYISIVEVRR